MQSLRTFLNKLEDNIALQHLAPFSHTFLPWTESSIRPSALLAVLNDIILNERTRIVELGGGISTLFISRLLRSTGNGRLVTIEHDERWVTILRELLAKEDLHDVCTVIHAPLKPTELALDGCHWYDTGSIEPALPFHQIDLLLVDGPPAYTAELALSRYPAVPYFRPLLAPHFCIFLDDIERHGEMDVLRRWARLLDLPETVRRTKGGVGLIRTGHAQTV